MRTTSTPLLRHLAPTLTPLKGSTVSVGREGNIVIDERLFEAAGDEQHLKTSRVHFEVFVRNGLVGLVDKSLHGTFVKGLKVGKDKEYRLNHGDVISVVEAQFEVYCLLLEEQVKLLFPEELGRKYLVGREVGRGASATVREAFSREDHTRRAVKLIEKETSSGYSDIKDLMREVEVLKGVKHPCITEVIEVFDCPNHIIIVMEYAAGGELFDQVVTDSEAGDLQERHAKIQFFQIGHALAFLHSRRICHRDLKLENVLLLEPGAASRIKVTDFGLSKKWSNTSLLETFVGYGTETLA